jgi:superfamily II DNA or RNA helicase
MFRNEARITPQSVFNIQSRLVYDRLELMVNNGCIFQHQKDALLAADLYLRDPSRPNIALLVLPTGTGKSGIAVLAPYVLNASKVLVITPSANITDQIAYDFSDPDNNFFIRRGMCGWYLKRPKNYLTFHLRSYFETSK